jgi:hypothetical protein
MNTRIRRTEPAAVPASARETERKFAITRLWQRTLDGIGRMSTTRANARGGLAADVLVSAVLLYFGLQQGEPSIALAISIALFGLVLFSLVEYCFHRWLFHGAVQVFEQGHRKHHEQPQAHDSLPFFLPPLVALVLAGGLQLLLPASAALLFTGGMASGYAAYGLTHTTFHNVRFRRRLARRWAGAHHIHHYHPHSNFGVTTPLWDFVLRTRYVSKGKRLAS